MTPTNRQAAATAGILRYNTGRPCRNGHIADRYTSTGNCCECTKSANKDTSAKLRASRWGASSRQFTYLLHPDDHAAALAYCQSLDLQRGRQPQTVDAAPPPAGPGEFALPPWLQAIRDGQNAAPPGLEQTAPARHIPAELARVLSSHK